MGNTLEIQRLTASPAPTILLPPSSVLSVAPSAPPFLLPPSQAPPSSSTKSLSPTPVSSTPLPPPFPPSPSTLAPVVPKNYWQPHSMIQKNETYGLNNSCQHQHKCTEMNWIKFLRH